MKTLTAHRAQTDYPILDLLAERWSTRIFDEQHELEDTALDAALEAARWAPSANNTQPWHVLVGRRGTTTHQTIFDALLGFNQEWAGDAAALIVFLAKLEDETGHELRWALYDTGQAAAYFTIQAQAEGLATHQMGGFRKKHLMTAFDLEPSLVPLSVMALGKHGDPETKSEELRKRELQERTRRSLNEVMLRYE